MSIEIQLHNFFFIRLIFLVDHSFGGLLQAWEESYEIVWCVCVCVCVWVGGCVGACMHACVQLHPTDVYVIFFSV